ncbi:MAG: hypothetical protein NC340_01160 [Ruminococcus flavefaciens]|nr:hypothetical protein [Ruminococcus flavefaciens]MCM1228754.1 hypothetical protein [Ruminococcus flavefaciens]
MSKSRLTAVFPAVILLTGCAFGTSIDTLMTPPKLSLEQEQIYSALTDAVGDSISLKYPKSGKYLSAFIVEDIDGDSGNEAVVFYEKTGLAVEENTLRINILDSDSGTWRSVFDTPADGAEIERVMISKLGENQRMNLIIGSSLINRSEKTVTIYSYSSGQLERTFSESYSFIDVTDLDRDGENEFLILKGSSNSDSAAAEAYKLDSIGKYHQYRTELSGSFTDFDNIGYGELSGGYTGLYIDAVSGAGFIQTDIIYMDEKGLNKIFSGQEESDETLRPSGCSSYDVDGDGQLEIPVQTISPGYEKASEGERINLTNWLYISENNKPLIKYTSYYSIGDGYIFIFPEKWHNKVTVKRDAVNDEIVFCEYNKGSEGDEIGRELLRIYCAEDEASREDRLYTGYMLLRTKGELSYLAYIPSSAGDDDLALSPADTAIGFVCKN